jgi:hypothetical protein
MRRIHHADYKWDNHDSRLIEIAGTIPEPLTQRSKICNL